jgi:hypothetical protein
LAPRTAAFCRPRVGPARRRWAKISRNDDLGLYLVSSPARKMTAVGFPPRRQLRSGSLAKRRSRLGRGSATGWIL